MISLIIEMQIDDKVVHASLCEEWQYQIQCQNNTYCLLAPYDLNVKSWFEMKFNNSELVGKHIISIQYIDEIEIYNFEYQELNRNIIYHINIENCEPLIFYLRNLSNDNYSGLLKIVKNPN